MYCYLVFCDVAVWEMFLAFYIFILFTNKQHICYNILLEYLATS